MIRCNDGSNRPPRLEIHQSLWGMAGIGPDGSERSPEDTLARIADAGFTGVLGRLPEEGEAERLKRLLDRYGLAIGVHSFPWSRSDLERLLPAARDFGVLYVNSQVMDNHVIDAEAVALLRGLTEAAAEAGVPYFVETHRGRVTQDLHRTVNYVRAVPELRLTIDFSHYVLAGEMGDSWRKSDGLFQELLRRTSSIHGRISNGQQIQVDVGKDADHPMVQPFVGWWEQGMRYWLDGAGPGDVLVFVPELGPPGYAITRYGTGEEISDRWGQALLLKRLAEEAWRRAAAASGGMASGGSA